MWLLFLRLSRVSRDGRSLVRSRAKRKEGKKRKEVSLDFLTQRPGKVEFLVSCFPGRRPAGLGSDQPGECGCPQTGLGYRSGTARPPASV